MSQGALLTVQKCPVIRRDFALTTGTVVELQQAKQKVKEVIEGECGILVECKNDIAPGDMLEAFIFNQNNLHNTMEENNSIQHNRDTKIEEQIREIAGRFIERETNKTALITVTRVELFERGRKAMVYITTLPEDGEASALNFLKRKRADIRDEVKKGCVSVLSPSLMSPSILEKKRAVISTNY